MTDENFTCGDRTPFTYLIGWSRLNVWYYGARYSKYCSPGDLWVNYFTSSQYVSEFRDLHGEPDILLIRKIFYSIEKCLSWESDVLVRLKAAQRDDFLNKRNGFKCIPMNIGYSIYLDKHGNKIRTTSDDVRVTSGELLPRSKGLSVFIDSSGNIIYTKTDDPRVLSGELVGVTKGFGVYKDVNTGKGVQASPLDPRVTSKQLIGYTTGYSAYKNINTGEMIHTTKSDPRVLSGELVGHRKII